MAKVNPFASPTMSISTRWTSVMNIIAVGTHDIQ